MYVHSLLQRSTLLSTHENLVCNYQERASLEDIRSIKIVGIDKKRPPRIRKEPYIDLFFRLSHQAPKKWCQDFNKLAKDLVPPVKIDDNEGVFIDAYVRDMDNIAMHLDKIKGKIVLCNEQYIEEIRQRESAELARNVLLFGEEGEQGKLNKIIAALRFDD